MKRVALVTGGTKNIGLAVARSLLTDGRSVVINGRDESAVNRAVDILRSEGGDVMGAVADVSDEVEVRGMFSAIKQKMGPVDIVVNNAGLRCHGPLTEISTADWNRVLEVVLTGSFLVTREAFADMCERRWGRIVNLAGISAQLGASLRVPVVAAKAGVIGLTKATATEGAPFGVTVNAISPGFVDTERSGSLGSQDVAESHYAAGRNTPVGRVGQPEDIARTCRFLCQEDAGYITGQVISVNGGSYM